MSADAAVAGHSIAGIPLVEWNTFTRVAVWRQGEHVTLVGPTGSGKTNLAFWLLPQREYVVILATKPNDPSLSAFAGRHGYRIMGVWDRRMPASRAPRRLIWPPATDLDRLAAIQAGVFGATIDGVYSQGGWCLYLDELWWHCQVLGLAGKVKMLLQQARSMNVSLVVGTQRPAWVPVECFDQASHLYIWRENDARNLERFGEISRINAAQVFEAVSVLPPWHCLYINTRTGDMMITRPPAPKGQGTQ